MNHLLEKLSTPGRALLASLPDGMHGVVLKQLLEGRGGSLLHVARDDARMARLAEQLGFFAAGREVLTVPAWDCLPYDRVSPHRDVAARRIDALTRLLEPAPPEGRLVITTVNALLQRLPPRAVLEGRLLEGRPGERLDPEALASFLAHNGYQRAGTVGEPGEFALRGGIVDVFPAGRRPAPALRLLRRRAGVPARLRSADPAHHRPSSTASASSRSARSSWTRQTVARFRSGYREAFGAVSGEDPLYEAVSEGRPHPGMEHWLPLFYDGLETLFDYLPGGAWSGSGPSGRRDRRQGGLETILDFYEARRRACRAAARGRRLALQARCRPSGSTWTEATGTPAWRTVPGAQPSPFAAPDETAQVRRRRPPAGATFRRGAGRRTAALRRRGRLFQAEQDGRPPPGDRRPQRRLPGPPEPICWPSTA